MRVADFWKTVNHLGTEFENLHAHKEKLLIDNKTICGHLDLAGAHSQSRPRRSKSSGRLGTPTQPSQPPGSDLSMSLRDASKSPKSPHIANGHTDVLHDILDSSANWATTWKEQTVADPVTSQAIVGMPSVIVKPMKHDIPSWPDDSKCDTTSNHLQAPELAIAEEAIGGPSIQMARSRSSSKTSNGERASGKPLTPREPECDAYEIESKHSKHSNTPDVRFPVWSIWLDRPPSETSNPLVPRFTTSYRSKLGSRSESREWRVGDIVRENTTLQFLIMRPTAPARIVWDLASILIMFYDIIFIPLLVFDLPEESLFKIMTFITAFFWTLDIIWSFFVGYHTQGIIEMRPRKIVANYIKTWFFIDIFVVAVDWYSILEAGASADALGLFRINKSVRLGRVFRILRFLRVAKVLSVLQSFSDGVHSEALLVILGVIKFVCFILIVNHYIACGWYAIAVYSPYEEQRTWVGVLKRRFDNEDLTFMFRYTSSLHWSFTQFTPASMEIFPENTLERIYSIVILMTALVVFSSFVSGITAAMTTLRQMNLERTRKTQQVRRFITDKRLSLELGQRIYNFMRNQTENNKIGLTEKDIDTFKSLPKQLLKDLRSEVFAPHILPHPFFHHMHLSCEDALIEICFHALHEAVMGKGQRLFTRGDAATAMMTSVGGTLRYVWGGGTVPQDIGKGEFVCEAVLWVHWYCQGDLDTLGNCDLIMLNSKILQNIATENQSLYQCYASCQIYAQKYAQHLSQKMLVDLEATRSSDRSSRRTYVSPQVTDLWNDFDLIQEFAQKAFETPIDGAQQEQGAGKRGFSKLKTLGAYRAADFMEPVRRVLNRLSSKG